MGNTKRVYYIGSGEEIEASEDGGQTWNTYTKCKTVDYGGQAYVWAPPGYKAVRKKLSTKHPFLKHVVSGKPMLEKNRSIYVAEPGGPDDSFLDLDAHELRHIMREATRDGLILENEYEERLSPNILRQRAERLLAQAAEKEGLDKPQASKRSSKSESRSDV